MSHCDLHERFSSNRIEHSLPSNFHHLKRSNAIRIKTENYNILPASLRRSIVASNISENSKKSRSIDCKNDQLTLLDQIKQGIRLHPVNERIFPKNSLSKHKQTLNQHRFNDSDNETLSDLLARVLKKRNLVMQQTDDESDQSSIDSQPDHYQRVNDFICEESEVEQLGENGLFKISSINSLQQTTGRIDIIVHL